MAVNVVLKSVWDDRGVKNALGEFSKFGKGVGVAFAAVGAATAAATAALIKFGSDSIAAAENVQQANDRLGAVAKSMNLFGAQTGAVTQRIIEFAEANELSVGVDAEVIKAAQAKLLTFKNLAQTANVMGGEFDRATMAALDLAAAGFGSAETNATQLGKALQDPIKGITALTRSGVTFTQEERNKIKVLVESGKTLEAQNMILSAIEMQVGGTAEATAKASDKMKLAFDNVSEAVGAALLPTFELFADEIVKLTPELEKALAPAAEEVAQIFKDQVLPAIQDFTKWLASPQGTQTIKNLVQAVVDAIKNFIDFIFWVNENKDALMILAGAIAGLVISYKTITTATALWQAAIVLTTTKINLATGATTALSTATKLLPWAALITAGAFAVATLSDYADAVYGSKINTEGLTESQIKEQRQLESLRRQLGQYEYALKNATEGNKKLAEDGIKKTRNEILILETRIKGATGEMARFNNIKLNNLRKEIAASSGEMNRFRNLAQGFVAEYNPALEVTTSTTTATASVEKSFEKVQKFIKSAQKDLAQAQEQYNKTIATAQKRYADAVIKTEADFAKKLGDIIQQSQDRLRNVFRQAASLTFNDFLAQFNQAEDKRLEAYYKAQEEAKKNNKAFTEDFIATDPVTALLKNLEEKANDNRRLLALSAKLFEAGFSQVFIEQMLSSGAEGGDAVAQGLLDSEPETIRRIQSLFNEINQQAETGMDGLAREIYDKAGFATRELAGLYETTQTQLADALKDLQAQFNQEVVDANLALIDSIKGIREAFKENIDSMKGDLGGLGKVVDEFMRKLGQVETDAKNRVENVTGPTPGATGGTTGGAMSGVVTAASAVTDATGIFIDSMNDVGRVIAYLQERITAANTFANEAAIAGRTTEAMSAVTLRNQFRSQLGMLQGLGGAAVGTTININVKTDSTQSLAMVGKTLGNTITKYVSAGGQVLVSPTN
jgi:hypothetical protein